MFVCVVSLGVLVFCLFVCLFYLLLASVVVVCFDVDVCCSWFVWFVLSVLCCVVCFVLLYCLLLLVC